MDQYIPHLYKLHALNSLFECYKKYIYLSSPLIYGPLITKTLSSNALSVLKWSDYKLRYQRTLIQTFQGGF